jgi:hypothetical protein
MSNYVDFLINVPWQPMLIAFIALAAGRRVPDAFVIVVAWFAGYSLTWPQNGRSPLPSARRGARSSK